MCILLLSTIHPDYPVVLLSNRDEFLHRLTQRAAYWDPPNQNVYSGRDLARPEKGTWLGVTREGRVAVLTNFREESSAAAIGEKSRGAMVTSFLTSPEPPESSTKSWIHKVLATGEMKGVGGFSLLCGTLRPNGENLEELAIISNRTTTRDEGVESNAHWVSSTKRETHGLSNSLFDDPWPKVKLGVSLLEDTLKEAVDKGSSEAELLEMCFAVLSHDTLPIIRKDDTYETELNALTESIFIPPFDVATEKAAVQEPKSGEKPIPAVKQPPKAEGTALGKLPHLKNLVLDTKAASQHLGHVDHICASPISPEVRKEQLNGLRWSSPGIYGTQTQTVILVNKHGHLKYVERRLYDEDAIPIKEEERDIVTEFDIKGWAGEAY